MTPGHKSVSRALAYTLTLGETDAWFDLSTILARRLDETERVALAYSILRTIEPDHRDKISATLGDIEAPAGPPPPPFADEIQHDADWWASIASQDELRAYFRAIYNNLSSDDKKIAAQKIKG